MTKSEYDEHIERIVKFLAHMVSMAEDSPNKETHDLLFQSISAAFMALTRERVDKYGMDDDIDADEVSDGIH